jgi:integrase
VERLGQCEVHRSLQTSSRRQATVRARRAWLATETAFATMHLNPILLAAHAKALIAQLLDEAVLDSPTADELVRSAASGNSNYHELILSREAIPIVAALPHPEFEKMELHLDRIVTRAELAHSLAKVERERRRADLFLECAKAAMARADEAEAQLARANVIQAPFPPIQAPVIAPLIHYDPPPMIADSASATPVEATVPPPAKGSATRGKGTPKFSEIQGPFLTDKTRGDEGYSGQTAAQVKSTFRLFMELVGDRPVSDYTGKDAGQFRDLLLRMPASHGKGGRIHALEAIRTADLKETASGEIIPRIGMKTAKRHFSALSQAWEWCKPRELVERNIFKGFTFTGTKSNRRLRDDWSPEDMTKLFTSSWYAPDVPTDDHRRWIPLIGMFAGLRLEEICRLRPAHDVVEIDGIHAFKIQEHDEPDAWSPKSDAGERVVPIHTTLIDLGLIDLVNRRRAEGATRLFPQLRPTGPDRSYGAEFSRKFGKFRQSLGISPKTVFHSFRHSVRTVLGNTELKDSWINALMGHEDGEQSVGIAVYLKRIGIQNLCATVQGITYPEDVMQVLRDAMGVA